MNIPGIDMGLGGISTCCATLCAFAEAEIAPRAARSTRTTNFRRTSGRNPSGDLGLTA